MSERTTDGTFRLREEVDAAACAERLVELGEQRSLPALLEKAWLLRSLGQLDDALEIAEQAVRLARMSGTRRDLIGARMLHATVQQYRGATARAALELATCAAEAEGHGWPRLAALAHQHRGRVWFEARDFDAAKADFKRALFLLRDGGAPDAALEPVLLAIDATDRERSRAGLAAESSVAS